MNLFQGLPALFFLCFVNVFEAALTNPAHPIDDLSINCGSKVATFQAHSGKHWQGDAQNKFSSTLQLRGSSRISHHKFTLLEDRIPYETARLSLSTFSYVLHLNPGPKILRLHFYPAPYKGFQRLNDLFSVKSGPFMLLSNFSASLSADALGVNYFVKEFCINVEQNQLLTLIFLPTNNRYAFINGIEVISMPLSRSYFHKGDIGVQLVGKSPVYIDNTIALEVINRVKTEEESGMWGIVKKGKEINNSVTWKISVDIGFRYLVRLHLSRLGFKMAKSKGFTFVVLINGLVADLDVAHETDDLASIPRYRDYMLLMKGTKEEGRRDLLICLQQTNDESMDGNEPLKGFEVLKLSNSDNSLASPNPLHSEEKSPYHVLGGQNTIANVVITFILLVNIIVYLVQLMLEHSHTKGEKNVPLIKVDQRCRCFSLAEIELATTSFSPANLIGRGGFGKVYKGVINNGEQTIAVKRLKSSSSQGSREFLTEIEMLSKLRHVNLVPLIGYCCEGKEMILVYEFMARGTLMDHLYPLVSCSDTDSSLSWKQRLNICIGAGRGLDYLHTGHSIIHRDVKASNILLDDDYVAKVSDFGLAKPLNRRKLQSRVSTKVKGTFGYMDPYYATTGYLTRSSDTFAFGVVLLEVLSERRALDRWAAESERFLSQWALQNITKGNGELIVVPSLRNEITEDSLKAFLGIAEGCLHEDPKKRLTMARVVLELEHALELQDRGKSPVPKEMNTDVDLMPSLKEAEANLKKINAKPPSFDKYKNKPADTAPGFTFPTIMKLVTSFIKGHSKNASVSVTIFSPILKRGDLVKGRSRDTSPKIFSPIIKKPEDLAFLNIEDGLASLEFIGKGGCGEVYKAILPGSNGKEIAIKKIIQPPRDAEELIDEDSKLLTKKMKQIKSEIQTIGQIRHRNLLPLLAHLLGSDCHYLVYEYMKNGNLQNCLKAVSDGRKELDWLARFKIALGVAAGLEYLHMIHHPRIIHRDLKPANILLDDEMEARIAGFWLAKAVPDAHTHVTSSNIAGTVGYIAPEYYQTLKFTDKCDVFSFGVVLGVLVMGKLPSDDFFQHTDEMSFVKWMRNVMLSDDRKRAIDPKLLGNGYEEQMLLVLKIACYCTHENPEQRPSSKDARCMLSQIKH